MYYTFECTYCERLFYTYHSDKWQAAVVLYRGVKAHLVEYNEDHKEYEMDDGKSADSDQIFKAMVELKDAPSGGYEVE